MYYVIIGQSDASCPTFIDSKLSLEAIPNISMFIGFFKVFLRGC